MHEVQGRIVTNFLRLIDLLPENKANKKVKK